MTKRLLFVFFIFLIGFPVAARQTVSIESFQLKESLIEQDRIAVLATDSNGKANAKINGVYQFSINGFKYELTFHDGAALTPQPIESSSFFLFKHKDGAGSQAKLFFIYKMKQGFKAFFIPWYWLIVIPIVILLIGYIFKKLFYFSAILVVGIFIFNYSKGLDLQNIFETLTHGVMELMGSKN